MTRPLSTEVEDSLLCLDRDREVVHDSARVVAQQMQEWFGVDFTVIDGGSGDVLHLAADQPCRDWEYRIELCQEVGRRNRPEFIEEDFPLLMLALPVPRRTNSPLVAIATFVTRPLQSEGEVARAAAFLRTSTQEARQWIRKQTVTSGEVLQRLARLAHEQIAARHQIDGLRRENDKLAQHVSATYEEISLLFRLTQNLRINASEAELGRMALQWMLEIMPFEGLALQLLPLADRNEAGAESQPTFITFGDCPLDNNAFTRMVLELGSNRDGHPVVLNRSVAEQASFPDIHQLILLPVGEGRQVFGYLAAFNHTAGCEFGTSEAELLNSVAAILGIHSGNAELYRQQAELLSGIVRALTSAIDAKDPYTCGHSDRVARVAVRLAEELKCTPKTIETIYLAGLLHDVGKIGIDDNVLRKPGKLTPEEFEHIQTHVRIGHNILVDLKQLDKVLPVVLHHHEAWDGTGYPDKLAGEQIPRLARIVAVADAFDAMKSDRPYRRGMDDDKLDKIIREGAGKQWDPLVVTAFFSAREDIRAIAYREGGENAFEIAYKRQPPSN